MIHYKAIASVSMLRDSHTCKTKAYLRTKRLEPVPIGPEKPNLPMEAGKAWHVMSEAWIHGLSNDHCMGVLEGAYKELSDRFAESDDRLHWSNISRIAQIWLQRHPLADQPFTLVTTEHPVTAPITAFGDEISDKADAIVAMKADGSLWSFETKTTGRYVTQPDWITQYDRDPQMYAHIRIARNAGYNVVGVILNGVSFNKLPVPSKYACRDKEHSGSKTEYCWPMHVKYIMHHIAHSDEQMLRWEQEARNELVKYRYLLLDQVDGSDWQDFVHEVPQEGIIGGHCASCDYRLFCNGMRRNPSALRERAIEAGAEEIVHSGLYEVMDG